MSLQSSRCLGRWYIVTAVIALALALAFGMHREPWAVAAIALVQMFSQTANALLKHRFHRLRPDHWLVWKEKDTSYPSGHATTATAFYLALFLLALHARALPFDLKDAALLLFGACVFGLPWSRLVLGAHYVTDVLGGWLFGLGWLLMLLAVAARAHLRIA